MFNVGDRETGESITFIVQDYVNGSFVDLPLQLVGIAADGVYYIPINNRVITGKKLQVKHDVTLATGTDGIKVHAHFRPHAN